MELANLHDGMREKLAFRDRSRAFRLRSRQRRIGSEHYGELVWRNRWRSCKKSTSFFDQYDVPCGKPVCRVGSCISRVEACSEFTHVTACTLAESPSRPFAPETSAVSLPPLLL